MTIEHEELGIDQTDIEAQDDYETLLGWKQKIDEDIQIMGIRIDNVKHAANTSGNYSDPQWFRAIRTKKKLYGILSQKIQVKLAQIKRNRRESFERLFVDVCNRELEPSLFAELKAMAMAEVEYEKQDELEEKVL